MEMNEVDPACVCLGPQKGHVICPCRERWFRKWLAGQGLVIVPREPTDEMEVEGLRIIQRARGDDYADEREVWAAMIDAAVGDRAQVETDPEDER